MASDPRVLIIEDNTANAELATFVLEDAGFVVNAVTDASDALALVASFQPDLILMDIQLPEVSGIEVTKWLKEDDELKHIPVIAVTAFAMKGDEERIRDAGADNYLAKPVSIGPFMTAVRALLERAV